MALFLRDIDKIEPIQSKTILTSEGSDNSSRITVALFAGWVVVKLFLATITLVAVEIWTAMASSVVVTRVTHRTGRIAVASWYKEYFVKSNTRRVVNFHKL